MMKRIFQSAALAVSLLFPNPSLAAISTFSPLSSSTGPSFSVGLPPSTSISSTSSGPIYLQVRAPTSYTWVAFGIGTQMAGARIFVVYADGQGNVTVSARTTSGHIMPQNSLSLQGGVEVLAGSGIEDGQMRANLRVTGSTLASASTSDSPFIGAWMSGSPINSVSRAAPIRQHSDDSYRQFTFDLSQSRLTADENPFIAGSSTSPQNPSSSSSGGTATGTDNDTLKKYQAAHGVIISLAVVLLFPLGAIFIRLGGGLIGHAVIQWSALIALIIGFGLGVKLGNITNLLYNTSHTIFGTILFALFLLQPVTGFLHHLNYKKHHSRSPVSHVHIWYGRTIMALAILNGGLGLRLAANSNAGKIIYAIVAGIVGVVYIAVVVWKRGKGKRTGGGPVLKGVGRNGNVNGNGNGVGAANNEFDSSSGRAYADEGAESIPLDHRREKPGQRVR